MCHSFGVTCSLFCFWRTLRADVSSWMVWSLCVKGHTFCQYCRSLWCRMKVLSSALCCCPALSRGTAALNLSPGRRCFCPSARPSEPHRSPVSSFTRLIYSASLNPVLPHTLALLYYGQLTHSGFCYADTVAVHTERSFKIRRES